MVSGYLISTEYDTSSIGTYTKGAKYMRIYIPSISNTQVIIKCDNAAIKTIMTTCDEVIDISAYDVVGAVLAQTAGNASVRLELYN